MFLVQYCLIRKVILELESVPALFALSFTVATFSSEGMVPASAGQ